MGQALLVAQTVATVVGSIQQANAASAAAKAQARADANRLEFEKQQYESAQRDELIAAKQEEALQRKELNDALSTIDAIRASRGMKFSTPTSEVITRDIKESATANIRTNRTNRLSRADNLRQRAEYSGNMAGYALRMGDYNASMAKRQGYFNAGISLVTGFARSSFGKSLFGASGNFGAQTGGQTGIAGVRNRINAARGFYGPGF